MRLVRTKQHDVLGVAARWKAQYCRNGVWSNVVRGSSQAIYEALAALGSSATPADVAAIIGNDSWTGESACHECGGESAVMVGEEPDYESETVYLCEACIRRALALIESAESVDARFTTIGSSERAERTHIVNPAPSGGSADQSSSSTSKARSARGK